MLFRSRAILILVAVFTMLAAGSPAPPGGARAAGPTQGDANCDSAVNSVDSLQVLRSVAGLSISAACLADAGDVNCDGAINSVDSLRILRYVAGLSNSAIDGCAAIGDALGPAASSFDLIGQALADGDIDDETALLYTTFAVFGDSRLPAQFAGDNAGVEDTLVLQRLSDDFDTLSPLTQSAVAPFMLPPSAPGSWLELPTVEGDAAAAGTSPPAVTWQTFSAVGGKVKVWAQDRYAGDAEKAEGVAQAMTNRIYPLLKNLMGREPPGDDGFPNNGGDSAIDIYLVHMENRGEMKSYGDRCKKGPGYLLVNSDRPLGSETSAGILQTAAHEFFHIMEWTYQLAACWYPEYRWAVEGFAKWSEDWTYPLAQSEQPYAAHVLDRPEVSLDNAGDNHVYGTYLLPYYFSHKVDGDLIRQVWEAFEGNANSVKAVGGVIGDLGGWDEVWPQVALYDWNREPVDDYKEVDALARGAAPEGGIQEISTGGIALNGAMNHLSSRYYHFKFLEEARTVEFKDNGLGAFPHLHVRALLKINGQWKPPEDWTYISEKTFCRDLPQQDLQELVLIVSNSDGDAEQDVEADAAPVVEGRDVGCSKWTGWVRHTHHGGLIPGAGDALETEVAEDVVFELDPALLHPDLPPRYWVTTGGSVSWDHSGSFAGCSGSGSGSYPIGPLVLGEGFGQLEIWDDGGETLRYNAVGTGTLPPPTTVMYHCPPPEGGEIPGGPVSVGLWWSLDLEGEFRIQPDGVIRDTVTIAYPGGLSDDTWEWEFHPAP